MKILIDNKYRIASDSMQYILQEKKTVREGEKEGEEYGEYCQAVNETVFNNGEEARKLGGYENMMMELTHVAAVAVGAMEALMRKRAREEAAAIEKTDL